MQKRLKEIVIYILENSGGLEAEQRTQLEAMHERLRVGAFPLAEIEEAIRQVLEIAAGGVGGMSLDTTFNAREETKLSDEALGYLGRLMGLGLIDSEQEEEILLWARRIRPEGADIADIQFLASTIIFDETLGLGLDWAAPGEGQGPSKH